MAQLSKSAYEALYGTSGTTFADNTTGDIGANDVRQFGKDSADSAMFISDNFIDEDSFSTNSATKAPSQQSVKAYVDANTGAQFSEVGIDTADVLTANATPVTIVAAPGANLVVMPIAFFVVLDYSSVAYATNTTFRFEINGVAVTGTNTTLLPGTADRYAMMHAIDLDVTTNLVNQALVFKVQTGNPTAGNSPIYVTCVYKTCDSILPL